MPHQRPRIAAAVLSIALALALLPSVPAAAADPPIPAADRSHTRIMEEGSKQGMESVKAPSTGSSVTGPQTPATGAGPTGVRARPNREVLGYAFPGSLGDPTVGYPSWQFDLLSTVVFFGLHIGPWDGYIEGDSAWSSWNSPTLAQLIQTAHGRGVRVIPSINLFDFGDGSMMCSGLLPANRAHTISQIRNEVIAKGADGVNVDYEGLGNQCSSSPPTARDRFTSFVSELRAAMPGHYIVVDSYGGSANDGGAGFFNIAALNGNVDAFMVMAYDLEYSDANQSFIGCATGPLCLAPTSPRAGYPWRQELIADQYSAVIPSSKVLMGIAYYARFACVDARRQNARVTGSVFATSYLGAKTVHDDPTAHDLFEGRDPLDPVGAERMDMWNDAACGGGSYGNPREMYWDDAEALGRKYDMVNWKNLRGVGIFTLSYGGGAPELWNTLASRFSLIPGPPPNLAAWPGDHLAVVSWATPASAGGPPNYYTITASPGGATTTIWGNATGGVFGNLQNGTSYTFTVTATNDNGTGPASAPSNAVTPQPSQCTQLSAAGSNPSRGQMATWQPGRLDLFERTSAGGALWHEWYQTAWGGPEINGAPAGGALASDPVTVSWAPGRFDVFGISADGNLYHWWHDGSTWRSESLGNPGGNLVGQVTAVTWGVDRIDIAVRTSSPNAIWHRWWDGNFGTTWSSWENHGNPGVGIGDPSLVSWSAGRLDIFAVGADGKLYHQWWPGGWFTTWEGPTDPGVTLSVGAPAVVSWAPSRLDIVVVDVLACTLWHRYYGSAGWSLWEPQGAPGGNILTSDPALIAWGPNRLDIFVLATAGNLWHKWYDGGSYWLYWEGQSNPGQPLTARPAGVAWTPGRLDVFNRDGTGKVWHNWWTGPPAWGLWEDRGTP